MLPNKAVRSASGHFCLPLESQQCAWGGLAVHPEDIRTCALTGLPIHVQYATTQAPARLRPLAELLDGLRHNADQDQLWERVAQGLARARKGGAYRIEAALLSPSRQRLAACAESKSWMGLKVQQLGAVYDVVDDVIIGRLAEGRRNGSGWVAR
jgi:hypothetical protein